MFGTKFLKSVLSVSIALQMPAAFAAGVDPVVADVQKPLSIKGASAAFCYAVEDGSVRGYNENEPVRTASVTKTLTTFWAVERLGPNWQYPTHIFYQPATHEMHIRGARDPFFDRDRMFTLLRDLNIKGVKQISRLTVDNNFWYWPDATEMRYMSGGGGGGRRAKGGKVAKGRARAGAKKRRHASNVAIAQSRMPASSPYSLGNTQFRHFVESEMHTDQTVAGDMTKVVSNLKNAMNTSGWGPSTKARYARARSQNAVLALPESVEMKVDVIDVVPSNPLQGKPGVYEFVVRSAPMKTYLKLMNIWSINPYAEEIFFSLGGSAGFESFMQKYFGMGAAVSDVNSGSGVNLHGKSREDSKVSCATVVRMIRRMDQDLESKWKLDLSDVLAVPGKDGGTWQDPSKTLVAKTGTLNNPTPAKNLAGVFETTSGEVYFGVFVDKRGGNKHTVQAAMTAFRRHFKGVEAREAAYNFQPIGDYTHLQLLTQVNRPK